MTADVRQQGLTPWVRAPKTQSDPADPAWLPPHLTTPHAPSDKAYPHMNCNQDDAECEPFLSCRDAAGKCVKCCDPATDKRDGCLAKLEAACNRCVDLHRSQNLHVCDSVILLLRYHVL